MIAGVDGPVALLSAETAHYLETILRTDLQRLRLRARGAGNERVHQELIDLRIAALGYRPRRPPEAEADSTEAASSLKRVSEWLSSVAVADLAGVTDSAVRLACREERLDARKVGGRWRITRGNAELYAATVKAA